MKAIVAEIDGKHMTIITEKGDFVKIKRIIACTVGSEIDYKDKKTYPLYRKLSLAAASFLLFALLSGSIYTYAAPYSYVSLDINPSVGMTLNRFERVIKVDFLNAEGEKVLAHTKNINNSTVNEAVSQILKSASDNGYIKTTEKNDLMVVVSTKDSVEEKKILDKISAVSEKELSKANKDYTILLEKTDVDSYKAAVKQNVSPGKVLLADKIKKANPNATPPAAKDLSVKQAMTLIDEGHEKNRQARDKHQKEEKEPKNNQGKTAVEKAGREKPGASGLKNPNKEENKNNRDSYNKNKNERKEDNAKKDITDHNKSKEDNAQGKKPKIRENKDHNNDKKQKNEDKGKTRHKGRN